MRSFDLSEAGKQGVLFLLFPGLARSAGAAVWLGCFAGFRFVMWRCGALDRVRGGGWAGLELVLLLLLNILNLLIHRRSLRYLHGDSTLGSDDLGTLLHGQVRTVVVRVVATCR